jgi:hypothetical protein
LKCNLLAPLMSPSRIRTPFVPSGALMILSTCPGYRHNRPSDIGALR